MQKRTLYELAGADPERRFSPYCWRIRMALAHKGLETETVPWCFTDKEAIAFSGQGKVPVLVDGEHTVADSWRIAVYLEESYPQAPSLFGPAGPAGARFACAWTDTFLAPAVLRFVLADIPAHLAERDRAYFRESREARFGKRLEEVCADRESRIDAFRQGLAPLRNALDAQPWLAGGTPGYVDYATFSVFQWARCVSPYALLAAGDPILPWLQRLAGAFDGLAQRTPGYRFAHEDPAA